MTRRAGSFTTIGILLLSLAVAAAGTGIVRGTVRSGTTPVVGARVVIGSSADSSYTASVTTDQQGRFTFGDAPVGVVEVKVYDADDHLLGSASGSVPAAGETVTLAVELRQ